MAKRRIYILVKTYPTISKEYSELVCTAGMLEDGSWVRLYPVPFRLLNDEQKYRKFTWVEVDIERNYRDFRPESFRPAIDSLQVISHSSKVNWQERNSIIFKKEPVYTNLGKVINEAKSPAHTSLATFKPTKVIDLIAEEVSREWDQGKLKELEAQSRQMQFFKTEKDLVEEFRTVRKVPYKFSYKFEDDVGKISTLMIVDWEIGMLYFNCLQLTNNDEEKAIDKVKEKYLGFAKNKDLYFFLGTTHLWHNRKSQNPFIIIGVYPPPFMSDQKQIMLSDLPIIGTDENN